MKWERSPILVIYTTMLCTVFLLIKNSAIAPGGNRMIENNYRHHI